MLLSDALCPPPHSGTTPPLPAPPPSPLAPLPLPLAAPRNAAVTPRQQSCLLRMSRRSVVAARGACLPSCVRACVRTCSRPQATRRAPPPLPRVHAKALLSVVSARALPSFSLVGPLPPYRPAGGAVSVAVPRLGGALHLCGPMAPPRCSRK